MKRGFFIAMVALGCLLMGTRISAQTPAEQTTPANSNQKPPAPPSNQSKPGGNQFPDDTTTVPVMPSKNAPDLPPETSGDERVRLPLPKTDLDPVRSPEDSGPDVDSGPTQDSSSSAAGTDKILQGVDDDTQPQGKHKKNAAPEPQHTETSAEDIEVGKYEMSIKNWKAAISRFESAMVLAPDEPDVYWGLAESERHLGNLAEARGYYQKLAEYDPDSKHGKDAIKALKEPEIANAKATPPAK